MQIMGIQWPSIWQDSQTNLTQLSLYLEQQCNESPILSSSKVDLIVLPELFHGGFSMHPEYFAECIEGEVSQILAGLAKRYQTYIVAGVAQQKIRSSCEGAQRSFYNTALVFDKTGQQVGHYIKQKLFKYGGEQEAYQPGYQSCIVDIDNMPFALFICYDLRFPELFRAVAEQVKGMIVIANWPASRQMHFETLLKARAIENQCFMIGINRIGQDGNGLDYIGGSMVVSPLGEVMALGGDEEPIIWAEVDIHQTDQVRKMFPFLADKT